MNTILRSSLILLIFFVLTAPMDVQAQERDQQEQFFSIEPVYLRSLGRFGETWTNSSGIYAGYGFTVSERTFLTMKTGVQSYTNKRKFLKEASLTVIPLYVGIQYRFLDHGATPFISIVNGVNVMNETVDLEGNDHPRSLARYFWQAGVGGIIPVYDNLGITISANYNAGFYDNDKFLYGADGAMMTAFEYTAGVLLEL